MAQVTQSSEAMATRGHAIGRNPAIRACRENQITLLHRDRPRPRMPYGCDGGNRPVQ
jgi:hypothetical protein